jgi:hypothetical protein
MKTPTFSHFLTRTLGVRTLTRPQRVFVRVAFDGLEPGDLTGDDHKAARQLFGDCDRIPPEARSVLAMLKGARVGGTWLCSLWLLYRACVADLSGLAQGETGFAVIVAPDMRLGRQALRFALGAAEHSPEIAPLIEASTADSFTLLRPDGCRVTIEALPATRGGSALRGRTLVAALMDESSFFRDRDSGVVNDSELYRALVVRCTIAGAKLLVVSTAWLESGVLQELVTKNHGAPSAALACIAPTLLMREGDARIAQVVAEERERDPENAAREFDCVTLGAGTSQFFPDEVIAVCTRADMPLVIDTPRRRTAGAGCDPAFAAGGDAAALVIAHEDAEDVAVVAEISELRGTEARVPGDVCSAWAVVAKRHHASGVASDSHYRESLREHFRTAGLSLLEAENTNAGKVETYTAARDRMARGKVAIPAGQKRLLQQLREVMVKRETGGRTRIFSPRKNGAHGDVASAFVLALWALGERPLVIEDDMISGGDTSVSIFGSMNERAYAFGDEPSRGF